MAISNDVILAGGTISLMEGTIVGNGTVGGDLVNDGGTISPGNQIIQAISPVPEPATWLLLGVGLVMIALGGIRKKRVSVLCVGICMGLFSTTPASGQLPQDGLLLWLDANSKWSIKDGNGFDANHASFNPNDVQTWEDQATFDGAQHAIKLDPNSWSYSTSGAFPNGGLNTNGSRFTYSDLKVADPNDPRSVEL